MAGATILSIGYDIDVKSMHDHWIVTAEAAAESISETTNAGSYLVDVIPMRECLQATAGNDLRCRTPDSLLQSNTSQSGSQARVSRRRRGYGANQLTGY